MTKIRKLCIMAVLVLILQGGVASAADLPHSGGQVGCSTCHVLHNASGSELVKDEVANLCLSCHFTGGLARKKPFLSAMGDMSTSTATSHSWSGTMPNAANDLGINNDYGLRTDDQIADSALKTRLGVIGECSNGIDKSKSTCTSIGSCSKTSYTTEATCVAATEVWTPHTPGVWTAKVTCSTCHATMSQVSRPWDPWSTVNKKHFMRTNNDLNQMCEDCHYYRVNANITGTATGGSTVSINDSTRNWTQDQWKGYTAKITSGANAGQTMKIKANTNASLTLESALGSAIVAGNTYSIVMTTISDLKTYDGNRKSHPVVKNLTTDVANASLFIGAAPYEPNCKSTNCAQTGSPRYHINGGSDTNEQNNIVLDANGKIRCLSCHGMHYTTSNSSTVGQP